MAYFDFVDQLDKILGKTDTSGVYCIYSKLLKNFTVSFDLEDISIRKIHNEVKVSYEDFPKCEFISSVKKGLFKSKETTSILLNGKVIMEDVPEEIKEPFSKMIALAKESVYSSPVQDVSQFNETLTGDFKYPLSFMSLRAIPHHDLVVKFKESEIGSVILEQILEDDSIYEKEEMTLFFDMIEASVQGKPYNFAAITEYEAVFIKMFDHWFFFQDGFLELYKDEEIQVFDENQKVYYLADREIPPEIHAVIPVEKILNSDAEITQNATKYDPSLFESADDD